MVNRFLTLRLSPSISNGELDFIQPFHYTVTVNTVQAIFTAIILVEPIWYIQMGTVAKGYVWKFFSILIG
jgi:hypothetical protein